MPCLSIRALPCVALSLPVLGLWGYPDASGGRPKIGSRRVRRRELMTEEVYMRARPLFPTIANP
jgi:hypothetical protein